MVMFQIAIALARGEADVAELWSLGLGEPHPVSGLHGRGSGDLLDAVLAALPENSEVVGDEDSEEGGPRRVALVGRPNLCITSMEKLSAFCSASRE